MRQRDDDSEAGGGSGRTLPYPESATVRTSPHAPRRIDVCGLFEGSREIVLVYRGADYRLRVTSNDKLILTK